MRIVVTGSSGKLGRQTVLALLEAGHTVVPADIQPPPEADASLPPTHVIDLNDSDQVVTLLQGCDAVCHLGNLPSIAPTNRPNGFRNNVATTFNVLHAAELNGVRRVVYASSIQVYGVLGHGEPDGRVIVASPRYLPIDEDHPLLPCSAYSLSKATGEWIAESFARRNPQMTVWSMRFTGIRALPLDKNTRRSLMWGLLTSVRLVDAAHAVLLACQTDRPGHTPLNIVAPGSNEPWSHQMLIERYGSLPEIRGDLQPTDALICGRRATELLGFRPAHCHEFQNA